MRLGKAAAYATLAVVHVAQNQTGGPVGARRIAEAYGIPPEYLFKILQQLVRAEVLRSETGRRGGFLLRKPPGRITLLDIIEAIEGPLNGELSVGNELSNAGGVRHKMEAACNTIAEHARSVLRQMTVKQLSGVK